MPTEAVEQLQSNSIVDSFRTFRVECESIGRQKCIVHTKRNKLVACLREALVENLIFFFFFFFFSLNDNTAASDNFNALVKRAK